GGPLAPPRPLSLSEKATPALLKTLRPLADDEKRPAALRVAAAAAVPGAIAEPGEALFAFLCKCAAKDRPLAERGPAAGVLARAKLSEAPLLELADVLKTAGPLALEALPD